MLTRHSFYTDLVGLLTRLKCPHPIPANSFQSPNFELMSSILCWLVKLLDATIPIQTRAGSEDGRVKLLNGIVSELSKRFDISVDMRQLMPADDRAVKELIKIASIIEKSLQLAEELSTSSEDDIQVEITIAATKRARSLVDEITEICSRLSSKLEKESEDSKDRTNALRFFNSVIGNDASAQDHCTTTISRKLDSTNSAIERLDKQCKLLISNQRGMEEKLQKKSIDLDRASKRLESLRDVRPAYVDEYEKLEKDLEVEYDRFVVRLRNKDYLEGELSSFNQATIEKQNKIERSMRRMQTKFREDELRILNGCNDSEVSSSRPIHSKDSNEISPEESDIPGSFSAHSTSETPRGSVTSRAPSEETPSELSRGDEHSMEGSEMSGSLMPDDDNDSDSNF